MKNITNEKPDKELNGRLNASIKILNLEEDVKDKSILDIGCGYGWFENFCVEHGCKNILGIDITEEDLKTIRSHVSHSNLVTKIGSAIDIPAENESLDTVVAWEVIEHIPLNTEEKMFSEVSRVLKKNGTFYLSTPYHNFISNVLDPAWWLIGHRHYTLKQLENFSTKYGFKVDDYWILGDFWLSLDMLNMYIAKWIFRRRKFFPLFFNNKIDALYSNLTKHGYVNIFVRFKKI